MNKGMRRHACGYDVLARATGNTEVAVNAATAASTRCSVALRRQRLVRRNAARRHCTVVRSTNVRAAELSGVCRQSRSEPVIYRAASRGARRQAERLRGKQARNAR